MTHPTKASQSDLSTLPVANEDILEPIIPKVHDLEPPQPRAQPRVWTVYAFFVISFIAMLAASAAVLLASFAVDYGLKEMPDTESLLRYALRPKILVLSMSATALALIGSSLCAAKLSPQPLRQRLGLNPSGISFRTTAIAMLGAPALGALLETITGLLGVQTGGTLKLISDSVQAARGLEIPFFIVAITLGPGIGEELVFRGYIQPRLIERHGPSLGIIISSALFGLMHMDALQSPLAGLLGVYIGFVAYRTGSLWPAILTHAFNNLLSVSMLFLSGAQENEKPSLIEGGLALLLFLFCVHHLLRNTLTPATIHYSRLQ